MYHSLLVVFATARLSCLWHGVLWRLGTCLHFSSWQQRLRPCVGLCPLHHVASAVPVPFLPALRYSPLSDPDPLRTPLELHAPFSSACAASSSCPCFLPLAPPCLSLLLASACCLPLRSCSFCGLLCPLRCLCVFWCVVCCPFLVWPLDVSVGCVLVCSGWSAPPVLLLDLCSLLRWLRTAKDCRPQHHTHTPATVISSLPSHLRLICPWIRLLAWLICPWIRLLAFWLSWLPCRLVHCATLLAQLAGNHARADTPLTRSIPLGRECGWLVTTTLTGPLGSRSRLTFAVSVAAPINSDKIGRNQYVAFRRHSVSGVAKVDTYKGRSEKKIGMGGWRGLINRHYTN